MAEWRYAEIVRVVFHSPEQVAAYYAALDCGDDRKDVLLAMENALNDSLGIEDEDGVNRIWLEPERS